MPAFAPGFPFLTKRALQLPAILLICLTTAWPVRADEPAPAAERLDVSRTAPADPDDPLQRWFREQDRLLDDILLRLTRIETLVEEIHRLVKSLPDGLRAAPAAPATPAPAAKPSVKPAVAPPAPSSLLDEWTMPLAGGVLGLLLLLWWAKRRRAPAAGKPAPVAPATPPVAVPPAPTFTPARNASPPVPASQPAPSAPPPPPPPAAPAPMAASASGTLPASGDGEQAIELAEIMLSMGLGHGAAQTLTEQIRSEPKQALRQWLKLLEVYRHNGQQEEFERSAEELRQHFNVQPEDWQPRPETQRSIADYPHIAMRITELWGKPGCLTYLQNLLDDNRGGARAGFPQAAAEDLLLLAAMIKSGDIPG